jgi:pimeloyl-ACP methyl ester carboxylesterase
MSVRHIQREIPPPAPVSEATDAFLAANAAHMRSMGIARLIDNGVSYADAIALHRLAGENVDWVDAGKWLGDRNLALAEQSRAAGFSRIAAERYLHACACYRFAQSAFTFDGEEKKQIYRKVVDCFREAMSLLEWGAQKLELPCRDGMLCGWLLFPPGVVKPPVVMAFGGADGWRESYFTAGLPMLHEGIAICLLDGPGQGESRLFHGLHLHEDFAMDFAVAIRHLASHPRLSGKVGVFGNSLGGTIAATLAAELGEVDACCVNGGSVSPSESSDRFPRGLDKIGAMMGTDDREVARRFVERMDLRARAASIRCPLLILHGGMDQLFTVESAQAIHDTASSAFKQMILWDDGEHCVYTHAFERNAFIAEFFATHLLR